MWTPSLLLLLMVSSTRPTQYIKLIATSMLLGLILSPMSVIAQTQETESPIPDLPPTESTEFSLSNQASYEYNYGSFSWRGQTNTLDMNGVDPLIDPRGQILGCGGNPLDDYTGFRVALYNPADPAVDPTGTELGSLLALTPTELPNILGNDIPEGIEPNISNVNPYPLTNEDQGEYSFLLNRQAGQLDIGRRYILVVDPPEGSGFRQRRIRLEITNVTDFDDGREQVQYRATSLDGESIGIQGETEVDQSVVFITDAERIGLQLLALQFMNTLCQTEQIEITKSGDRANAAPGDVVIYRLTIRNISDVALNEISITDQLPLGFKFLDQSLQGVINETPVVLTSNRAGRTVTLSTDIEIPVDDVLTIVYAAQLTPDALRGDGRNSAFVEAQRTDVDFDVADGPALHRVRITPGILSDCATILGRVFVDHNFDGKQQPGEPGVPNAAVFMDDGNRITTDEDGLFHVKCVLPGRRSGALDLTTLPGYTLAPNLKFIERNSPSRLVNVAPGSLVRMNFAVTPSFQEEGQK